MSKLDLCEGGSFSTTIFNSDIQLSVLYSFVALLKATNAKNVCIVFVCLFRIKKRLTSCVF